MLRCRSGSCGELFYFFTESETTLQPLTERLLPKVLRRSHPRREAKAAVFCQRLLRRAAHPGALHHLVHLSGHSHQRHHVRRPARGCHRKHAGINPPLVFRRCVKNASAKAAEVPITRPPVHISVSIEIVVASADKPR